MWWTNKQKSISATKRYSAVKGKEVLIQATTRMNAYIVKNSILPKQRSGLFPWLLGIWALGMSWLLKVFLFDLEPWASQSLTVEFRMGLWDTYYWLTFEDWRLKSATWVVKQVYIIKPQYRLCTPQLCIPRFRSWYFGGLCLCMSTFGWL